MCLAPVTGFSLKSSKLEKHAHSEEERKKTLQCSVSHKQLSASLSGQLMGESFVKCCNCNN